MGTLDEFIQAVIKNDLPLVKRYFKIEHLYSLDKNDFTGFHTACNSGHTEIARFLIDQNINIEYTSPNGWNGLHWAAGNGKTEVVELLLAKGANIETQTKRKYRPLHLAIISNHASTARVLLANGCDWNAKNKDNKTSLEMAEELGSDDCLSLLKKWTEYDKVFEMIRQCKLEEFKEAFLKERINVPEANSSQTVLDVAVESYSRDCLEYILLQDFEEDILLGSLQYTLNRITVSYDEFRAQYRLYRSIIFDLREEFENLCLVEVVNCPWILTGESFLDVSVKFSRKYMVEYIMESLLEPRQTLILSLELASEKGSSKIADVIRERIEFLSIKERACFNRLHVAIQDNRVDMTTFMLSNQLVDANESSHVVGTPLCLALFLGNRGCIRALLDHNANVNILNKYCQSPLHIAIESGLIEFIPTLIDRTDEVDLRDCFGFTALHHATINKDDAVARLLLNKGANLFTQLNISSRELGDNRFTAASLPLLCTENPVSLCLKLHRMILPSFMDRIDQDNVQAVTADGCSALHLSARLLLHDVCSELLLKGVSIHLQNNAGNTALHSVFLESFQNSWQNEGFLETLYTMVQNGADINQLNNDEVSAFRCAFDTNEKSIINCIISQSDKLDSRVEDFLTVYANQWPDVLETMLSLQNDEFKRHIIIESVNEGLDELVDFILDRSPDGFRQSSIEDCLYHSAKVDNEVIFDKLLLSDLQSMKHFPNGETLLTMLIIENNVKYSLNLAKSEFGEKYIDQCNESGQTPLYLAAEFESLKLCKYLAMESHNMEYKDAEEETAMEKLLRRSSNTNDNDKLKTVEKIVKTMIQSGLDINRLNKRQERAISLCQNVTLKNKLESFHEKNVRKRPRLQVNEEEDKNICEVCLTNNVDCQFGCGHPFCRACATRVPVCPKCRKPKIQIIPLYLS